MREMEQLSVPLREAVNGIMACSALLLVCVFGVYCWRERHSLLQNDSTLFALSILIVMGGHFMRAFYTWVALVIVAFGYSPQAWIQYIWLWFPISAALIIIGDLVALFLIAPKQGRKLVIGFLLPLCVVVPTGIALLAEWLR